MLRLSFKLIEFIVDKIRFYKAFVVLFSFVFVFSSCINESEDDLVVDCALSDIAIQVTNITDATVGSGGSITVVGSGGRGDYSYSINGVDFVTTSTFDGLVAGEFTITIMDVDTGCTASVNATVNAIGDVIAFNVDISNSDCESDTGTITVNLTNGDEPVEYSIDETNFVSTNVFEAVAPGDYTVSVRNSISTITSDISVLSNVTLTRDIMPIINTYCALPGCHADRQTPNLNTNAQIIGAASGILARTGDRSMPPRGAEPLSDAEIAEIACWVNDGALEN